jgi:voltage-gated potassium channel
MVTYRNVLKWTAILAALLLLGSLGFVWLEGWSFFDALYMTVTTLTTIGYGEIHPLNRIGRIYNMGLILAGMGIMLYVISSVARMVVEGEIREVLGRRKLAKGIQKLKNHYIICGFGRIGEIISRQLQERGLALIVVDKNPDLPARLEELDYYYVVGDATREEVLREAGIERARGLVSVVASAADNVYITLTARALKRDLLIVARGGEPGCEKRLLQAGADKVVSPYEIGGRRMAHTILHPTVIDFLDLALREGVEWSMEEKVVGAGSSLAGFPLKDTGIRQRFNLIIVAITRADGAMIFNPQPETPILEGDTLIALGNRSNLDALDKVIRQDSSSG